MNAARTRDASERDTQYARMGAFGLIGSDFAGRFVQIVRPNSSPHETMSHVFHPILVLVLP